MEEPFQIAGINRNILECKDYCFLSTLFRALVLIETYWNVKCEYQFQFGGYLGINRNILECKGGWRYLGNDCRKRINRNILECKALSFVISILSYPGINRNILECKGPCGS